MGINIGWVGAQTTTLYLESRSSECGRCAVLGGEAVGSEAAYSKARHSWVGTCLG